MPQRESSTGKGKLYPNRRRALAFMASGVGLCALTRSMYGILSSSATEPSGSTNLVTAPIKVPHDFVGMHAHRWPAGNPPSPSPTYRFGSARSHDHDGVSWDQIHKARGSYSWEALDRWVAAHDAAQRTLIYTLYGTPAWLAERLDLPDLYGRPGGAAAPRDLAPLAEFIGALTRRYNADGRRRIHFIETWNEPHFTANTKDFWWGTAEQLVGVGRTVYLSAKAVDPGVRVLSPGFAGDLTGALSLTLPMLSSAKRSSLYQYLIASDGHGGSGSKWCDAIAFHTYNAPLEGDNVAYMAGIIKLQKMLGMMQITLPLYNTECGFIAPHAFHNLTPAEQGLQLKRLGAIQAALGMKALYLYSHDDDFVGNPSKHPEIARTIDELHRSIAGATLHEVILSADGATRILTDFGAFTW